MPYRRCTVLAVAVVSTVLLAKCSGSSPSGPSGGGGGGPTSSVVNAAGDIGECGFGALETGKILDGLSGTILALGDLAYMEGSAADFTRCYDPAWGRHKGRTRPVPGNHEYETDRTAKAYYDYFGLAAGDRGAGYYAFTEGPWRIIALNDNIAFGIGSAQMEWLRDELEHNRTLCTLAYWHKPLFSSGPNGTANDGLSSRVLWNTLMEFGVDVVLNGHDHEYERFAPQDQDGRPLVNGIREFVVGTGGAHSYTPVAPKPNSEVRLSGVYGILRLNLFNGSYHWDFHTGVNAVADRGDGACH
jgi:3',5'-cyclic AMP phosphodiesterase CpdA